MSAFLYVEINTVGIILLLLMLNNMNDRHQVKLSLDQWLFNCIMILNALLFVFDAGMWILDGTFFTFTRPVFFFFTIGYFLLMPLICLFWLLYTDFKIYESRLRLKRIVKYLCIPVIFSTALTLISPYTGWYYVINKENYYERGPFLWLLSIISFSYIVVSLIIAVHDIHKRGWKENRITNFHLIVFPIVIVIVALVQLRYYGISIIWVCSMMECVGIYINIQNGEIYRDYLTGLNNRRRIDHYLYRKIRIWTPNKILFAVVLDLNDFKTINDSYGHLKGDEALTKAADILRKACYGKEDFIARMGGDEFIIIGERSRQEEIDLLLDQIGKYTLRLNKMGENPYHISFSMGISVFQKNDTQDDFINRADKKMYQEKQKNKKEQNLF